MARPKYKLLFKNKLTLVSTEVGVLWENEFGGYNLKAATEETKWATPLLAKLADTYWMNLYPVKSKEVEGDKF